MAAGPVRESGRNRSQLTKKLSIFPGTKKINPLAPPEERSIVGTAATHGAALAQPPSAAPVPWSDLPLNVVEKIFRHLKQKADRDVESTLSCTATARVRTCRQP